MARAGHDANVAADLADAWREIDDMDRGGAHPEDILSKVGIRQQRMSTDVADSLASAVVATARAFERLYLDSCDDLHTNAPDDVAIVAEVRTEIINEFVRNMKSAMTCIGECSLGTALAYRDNHDFRDMEEAADATLKSYLPYKAVSQRYRVNLPRDLEGPFKDQALVFEEIINPRNGGRRDDRHDTRDRDRRRQPDRNVGGMGSFTSNLRERRSSGSQNGGITLTNPAHRQERQERPQMERRREEEVVHQQQQPMRQVPRHLLMTSTTFNATDKCPHPPFYYDNGQKAMVSPDGGIAFMNFDPAALELPPEHRPIMTLTGLSSATSGIRFAPAGATKPFDLPVECITALDMSDATKTVIEATRLSKGPGVVARLHYDLDVIHPANVAAFKKFIESILNKSRVNQMVEVMAEHFQLATSKTELKGVSITEAEYWFVNRRMTTAFRMASELMFGIDPMGIARIGTFGPTGHPDDDDDVGSMIDIVDKHCGASFAVRFGDKIGSYVKALAFAPHEVVMADVEAITKQHNLLPDEYLVPSNFRVMADCNDLTPIVDLLANRWRPSGDGVPSPYGFAPCTIHQQVAPMLHSMVTRLYSEYSQYNISYMAINFGPGQMLVTRSAHNGEFVGQWNPF